MARDYDRREIPTKYALDDLPSREGEGSTQRFLRGIDSMVGITELDPGRESNPHSHPWEQLTVVLSGACRFDVDGTSMDVAAGDAFFVPPDASHRAVTDEEACTLLFAGPLREDALPYVEQTEFPTESP
jgi:quercetin dioxygenase-like cupin family protein